MVNFKKLFLISLLLSTSFVFAQKIKSTDYSGLLFSEETPVEKIKTEYVKDSAYEQMNDHVNSYQKNDERVSFGEFFLDNILMCGSILLVLIVAALGLVCYQNYTSNRLKKIIEHQNKVVEAFSRDYMLAFLIKMADRTCELLKIDGKIVTKDEIYSNKSYPYSSIFEQYVISRVYKSDQKDLLNALQLNVVKERLSGKDEYSYSFRIFENEDVHYYQAKFLKLQSKSYDEKVILAFQNIDAIVAAAKERELLKIKAETDPLTEVVNFNCGEEMVTDALIEKKSGGMYLTLEIDGLDEINDKYGHLLGDSVLVCVADCLKKAFRAGDIIYRAGENRFSVLAFNIETEEAGRRVTERFFTRLQEQKIDGLGDQQISTSVGARIIMKDEIISFESLKLQTEKRLSESKTFPGNYISFF